MPTHPSSLRQPLSTGAVVVLALSLLSGAVSAADETQPTASPEPSAAPATEAVPSEGTWGRTSRAPFGAIDVSGGWTGTELVVVDPEQKRRAAAYYPSLDSWRTVSRPPRKVQAGSPAYWTGSELIFVEPRGAARHGLVAYDPTADRWRTTAHAPTNAIVASTWAGDRLVVAASSGAGMATYDPSTDTWTELPALPTAMAPTEASASVPISLHWTGEQVLALTKSPFESEQASDRSDPTFAFVPLDLERVAWAEPSVGPLAASSSQPLWVGDSFVFLTPPRAGEPTEEPPMSGRYDPTTQTWTTAGNDCRLDTGEALWTDTLILDMHERRAFDPAADECHALPVSPWAKRTGALRVWTGREALELSGRTARNASPRRDGLAFVPIPGDGSLWVPLDKPSRPVRIRVPALGIDLPVISDERRVKGSTPGYPACDVALYWSYFDLPGEPGTTWILAHAQRGMFLPLLAAATSRGSKSLIGRRVELQLRDGRLLTYRTYKVKPRASTTDLSIASKGRRRGEHRLVLQTSTGVGAAPKLQVAARLVDASTTDEPRPKPRPRACG